MLSRILQAYKPKILVLKEVRGQRYSEKIRILKQALRKV
jgi:hypothetical protein